jgi:hypothetical protein
MKLLSMLKSRVISVAAAVGIWFGGMYSVSEAAFSVDRPFETIFASRTVTTTVQADSSGEAVVKAQQRYPKGKVTSVRKVGSDSSRTWIVTLKIED